MEKGTFIDDFHVQYGDFPYLCKTYVGFLEGFLITLIYEPQLNLQVGFILRGSSHGL